MSGAILVMAVLAVLAAFEAVQPLIQAFQYLGHSAEAGGRILALVHTPAAVTFPTESGALPSGGDVTLRGVSFRYDAQHPLALDAIDLHVRAGQRVAVVGESGSGKSTILYLLARFWEPTGGWIGIGGCDIRLLSEHDLRRQMAVVTQQPHIFNASLRDNLTLVRPGASDAALFEALGTAQLQGFVRRLPGGLDTPLGEHGQHLSGGQLRRLAIARAVLFNGPIWLLDEPTEGLDATTARAVTKTLLHEAGGRTVMWMTHDLAGLHLMDRVVVLARGRIVEQGAPADLLGGDTYCGRLVRRNERRVGI
jgi:ATP-binding cassette subfamily C protein CydC